MSRFSPIQYSQEKTENIDLNNHYVIEKTELDEFREDYQQKKKLIKNLISKIDDLTRENTTLKNKINDIRYRPNIKSTRRLSSEDKSFVVKMMQCDW
jgi:hypothetical protein